MIVSKERRFIFVHIHKTAGEAVTLALLPHMGRDGFALGATSLGNVRNLYYQKTRGISKHSSAAEIRNHVGTDMWNACFTFAFVRHPFDRVRSLYSYLGMMSDRRARPGVRNLLHTLPFLNRGDPLKWPGIQAYRETDGFSAFIRHPGFRTDPGSDCQVDLLSDQDGDLIVDFVGHFERLEADFAKITAQLGLSSVILPKHNVSHGPGRSRVEMTADDMDLLAKMYRRDFEAFGFSES